MHPPTPRRRMPLSPVTPPRPTTLVTGATGYVGGRLWRRLEERGEGVRLMVRRPTSLPEEIGAASEVVRADVLEPATLGPALEGIRLAYYLIHSLGARAGFDEVDRRAAHDFARAARAAGVERIVYLGGLAHDAELSDHLGSRQEVGRILRAESGAQVIELRASVIIGSASLSFDMIRSLVRRLPVMVTPRWVEVASQPIAIDDVLEYLEQAGAVGAEGHQVLEVGGADVVSYGDMMREYARQRGLRRWMVRVPFLTPRLSSLWLGLVTPLYARVGRKLIESIRHASVVRDARALDMFDLRPRGMPEAMRAAIEEEERAFQGSNWHDALSAGGAPRTWAGVRFHNRLIDDRSIDVEASTDEAFAPVERIGGRQGWYAFDWLWKVRGFIDLLVGGVGVRRGRPASGALGVGDRLDFWRVEVLEPGRRLRLAAEMKLPGRAWLEFNVTATEGGARIRQTAIFDPVGLAGLGYWYGIYPLHRLVFASMLKGIAKAATRA